MGVFVTDSAVHGGIGYILVVGWQKDMVWLYVTFRKPTASLEWKVCMLIGVTFAEAHMRDDWHDKNVKSALNSP